MGKNLTTAEQLKAAQRALLPTPKDGDETADGKPASFTVGKARTFGNSQKVRRARQQRGEKQ